MFHLCYSFVSAIFVLNLHFRVDEYDILLNALRISLQNCAEHMFCRKSAYAINAFVIFRKNQLYENNHQTLHTVSICTVYVLHVHAIFRFCFLHISIIIVCRSCSSSWIYKNQTDEHVTSFKI